MKEEITCGVLICGFNRIYNAVGAGPWDETRPGKGKVSRYVITPTRPWCYRKVF